MPLYPFPANPWEAPLPQFGFVRDNGIRAELSLAPNSPVATRSDRLEMEMRALNARMRSQMELILSTLNGLKDQISPSEPFIGAPPPAIITTSSPSASVVSTPATPSCDFLQASSPPQSPKSLMEAPLSPLLSSSCSFQSGGRAPAITTTTLGDQIFQGEIQSSKQLVDPPSRLAVIDQIQPPIPLPASERHVFDEILQPPGELPNKLLQSNLDLRGDPHHRQPPDPDPDPDPYRLDLPQRDPNDSLHFHRQLGSSLCSRTNFHGFFFQHHEAQLDSPDSADSELVEYCHRLSSPLPEQEHLANVTIVGRSIIPIDLAALPRDSKATSYINTYLRRFFSVLKQEFIVNSIIIIDGRGVIVPKWLEAIITTDASLKIFIPVTILALLVLIPVNVYDGTLSSLHKEIAFSDIDKLSISNVSAGSQRFWFHLLMAYLFTIWTCYVLYKEYDNMAFMRLHFLASQDRRVDQFSIVVRNIPHVSGHSISENVEQFFQRNHPNHYLCHQAVYNANKFAKSVRRKERLQNWLDYYQLKFERHPDRRPTIKKGFLGLCGGTVDAIEYYSESIRELDKYLVAERQRILKDPKAIMPVAFVSFDSRWAAAICAQTQQSRNPTRWLTYWAPEPRDVYWRNLAIPFVSLSIRKLLISLTVFALVFFYMIPIAAVQSLANLDGLEKVAPFLRPVVELKVIKSFLQGFLSGLALKIFLYILPTVLMIMSKIEGHFSLYSFIHQPPTQIPRTIGVSIPMKATFFITYIMVDGWAGIAGEILRLKPLVIYYLKNAFLVKTERDRVKAMTTVGPLIQLAIEFDPSILVSAIGGTVVAFGCFSAAAVVAKRRESLYVGGLLSPGISILIWLSFASFIFGSTATFSFELYFGLLIFLGLVVLDTQSIIERAHHGDLDYVKHALVLFVDFVGILVRILIIVLKNSEKSEEKKRRRRNPCLHSITRKGWLVAAHERHGLEQVVLNEIFWLMTILESTSFIGSQEIANMLAKGHWRI